MRHISTLGPRDVIHCPTVQEYMDIRTLMLTNGFSIPKPESWTDNAANTCVLQDGKVTYLGYCHHKKLNIIQARELLVTAEPDWDYEDRMECLNDNNFLVDYIFLGIATSMIWLADKARAVRKFFTRRPKINL